MQLITHNEAETKQWAQRIAGLLKPGDIIGLFGDLGAGKTTFVQGLAAGLKVSSNAVHSPTFVFLNIYDGKLPLYHFDLYRVENIKQIGDLGYEEFLYGQGVAVIEWTERLGELTPAEYLQIKVEHRAENERLITLMSHGKKYKDRFSKSINKTKL